MPCTLLPCSLVHQCLGALVSVCRIQCEVLLQRINALPSPPLQVELLLELLLLVVLLLELVLVVESYQALHVPSAVLVATPSLAPTPSHATMLAAGLPTPNAQVR